MTSQPNFLVIMVDQLNGTLFPDGPADWLHTPNLKRLASNSTKFRNAYTCLLYTSPSPRDRTRSRMPSSA